MSIKIQAYIKGPTKIKITIQAYIKGPTEKNVRI